jgi:hypothetical protein
MDEAVTMQGPVAGAATGRAAGPLGFMRLGARAAVAAPLVAVFSVGVGAPIYADDLVDSAGGARFALATATSLAVLVLLAIALVAFWRRQESQLGSGGHAAFTMALVGTVLAAGGAWDQVFTVPWLYDEAPAALEGGSTGSLAAGFFLSYALLAVGWMAFATATLRARVLPRAAAIVTLVGAVIALLPAPTALRLLVLSVGAALLGRGALRA